MGVNSNGHIDKLRNFIPVPFQKSSLFELPKVLVQIFDEIILLINGINNTIK